MPITTEEDALEWVSQFEEKSLITWRKKRTFPDKIARTVFKVII